MPSSRPPAGSRPGGPARIDERAQRDHDDIRRTIERAGSLTAVPGRGGVALGVVAVADVPLLGALIVALGGVAPSSAGTVLLAAGFGALQRAFGVRIARRAGG